jgi:hypothetical protein
VERQGSERVKKIGRKERRKEVHKLTKLIKEWDRDVRTLDVRK